MSDGAGGKKFGDAWNSLVSGDLGSAWRHASLGVKQAALDLSDLEVVMEEATSSEPWGPHGKTLAEISRRADQSQEQFREITAVLSGRIADAWRNKKKWRQAYKGLLVIEHLIKNASEDVVAEFMEDGSMDIINSLKKFEYVDDDMKDHGLNIRKRSGEILALLRDPERLGQERERAKETKRKLKMQGDAVGSDSMGMRHGTLHDSDNITTGGWSRGGDGFGKGKRTLVRTKDSFTKPAPVTVSHLPKQRQGNPPTDTTDGDNDAGAGAEASATATEPVDLLGLGSQEVQSSSYASVLLDSAVPTPTKIDAPPSNSSVQASRQHLGELDLAIDNSSRVKPKKKVLSQTKINPKIQSSFSSFPKPPTDKKDGGSSLVDDFASMVMNPMSSSSASASEKQPSANNPGQVSSPAWAQFEGPSSAAPPFPAAPAHTSTPMMMPPLGGDDISTMMAPVAPVGATWQAPMNQPTQTMPSLHSNQQQNQQQTGKKDPFEDLLK